MRLIITGIFFLGIIVLGSSGCTTQKKYGCPSAVGDATPVDQVENTL